MNGSLKIFFKDYGTLMLAIYGILQLWIVGIWKMIFRRARVENFLTNTVEIGYSNFGPTVALFGTLASLHKESFINNISLIVRRIRDNAEYHFDWLAFRSTQFSIGINPQITFELASGFMITPTQPHRYNILFSDRQRWSEMEPLMRQIERDWSDRIRSNLPSATINYNELFANFVREERSTDFHTRIQRMCYWEAGTYSVQIRIQTANPNRFFLFNRNFVLTEEDAERLRFNTIIILAELCRQPNLIYNFAYPVLQ